jgi:ABC-type sulfate/molybdate transport systems ATPase subunit/ABC-type sulfate transport system permease component
VRPGLIRSPLPWLAGLVVLYLALPVVAFLIRFAGARSRGFASPGLFPSLVVSVEGATISLVLLTLFGLPLAYLLARSNSRLVNLVGLVVQLPLALPPLISGFLLIYLVGPYTFLGRAFQGRLTMSLAGVVLAQSFVAAPFLIVSARSAFGAVEPGLLDVAATLGHSEFSRFWYVALPVASPGIRAGMLLTWLRAFGEYGAIVVLAYHPYSLPIYTYNQFSSTGLPTTLAPTALALAVAVAAVGISRVHRGHRAVAIPTPPPRTAPNPSVPAPATFDVDHQLGTFHLAVAHRAAGNHLAIVGPSGSGKSALLRCLAGLYGAGPGPVSFGDRDVRHVAAERRRVGYVAQGFSLFPHLTVWQQLRLSTNSTPGQAAYWLAQLGLEGLQDRRPAQLSGGQRQRVALAQALCGSPQLLLLDEPFSALDAPVRRELQQELRRLQRETDMTTVVVTHDPEEAALLSDEVLVLSGGTSLQDGATRSVFERPVSPEVGRLLGIANLHRATVADSGWLDIGGIRLAADTGVLDRHTAVLWSIRAEEVRLASGGGLPGTVQDVADRGTWREIIVMVDPGLEFRARTTGRPDVRPGDACALDLPRDAIDVWPAP